MWHEIGKTGFDLIVDDGLHTFTARKTLFEASFDRLKPGGLYVIEDVSVPDLLRFEDWFATRGLPAEFHQLWRAQDLAHDNNLVIYRKPGG